MCAMRNGSPYSEHTREGGQSSDDEPARWELAHHVRLQLRRHELRSGGVASERGKAVHFQAGRACVLWRRVAISASLPRASRSGGVEAAQPLAPPGSQGAGAEAQRGGMRACDSVTSGERGGATACVRAALGVDSGKVRGRPAASRTDARKLQARTACCAFERVK